MFWGTVDTADVNAAKGILKRSPDFEIKPWMTKAAITLLADDNRQNSLRLPPVR